MNTALKRLKSGFTLLEILVVVAILGILAVFLVRQLNPAEASRKTRDGQRLKELGTMQTLLDQYINDNPAAIAAGMTQRSTANSSSNVCGVASWMGINLCPYANSIPKDPLNRTALYTDTAGVGQVGLVAYAVAVDTAARYRICARLESVGNTSKLRDDGQTDNNYYEVFSSTDAPTCATILP